MIAYTSAMDASFIQGRIDATKTQIIVYEDAVTALGAAGGVQSYKLDTGQSIINVTRADLSQLQKTIDGLYNRCATLEVRLNGSGSSVGKPAW